ncbi:MAG: prephenate dehydrogenase [Sumerlaeia bacterium]
MDDSDFRVGAFTLPGNSASRSVQRLIIWGVGLLGGSVSLASRRAGFTGSILGIGRNAETLQQAKKAGLVSDYTTDPQHIQWQPGDFIVLCQPVSSIVECIPTLLKNLPEGCLVTDVGSTKQTIVQATQGCSAAQQAQIVGSHPMAGSEKTGFHHASETLFVGATTIVTSTEGTNPEALACVMAFWKALGSRLIVMHPQRHDELIALISHVPHMTAAALVNLVDNTHNDPSLLRLICGNGFRDTTRIAQGSSAVWSQICQENSAAIADQLDSLSEILREYAQEIRMKNMSRLKEVLDQSSELRKKMG